MSASALTGSLSAPWQSSVRRASVNFCPAQHRISAQMYRTTRAMPCSSTHPYQYHPNPRQLTSFGDEENSTNHRNIFLAAQLITTLLWHTDIFFPLCQQLYKRRNFYQAPNGRADTVILRLHDEIDAFCIFLASEQEIVSRLTKRELLQFVALISRHWPSVFFC